MKMVPFPARNILSGRAAWFAAGLALTLFNTANGQTLPPAPVHVAKVVQSDVTSGHAFVGTVMPTRVAVIGSAVDGRVTHFYVNEGDRVKADQPLAQLLTNTLEIQLAGAKAELELRRQELAELENGTRPEEVNQAKAHLEEMKALKAYTEAKLERAKRLVKSRSGTEDELEDAISAHQQAEQKFRNAEAAHEMAVNGPRQERIAQARAKVQVQQAVVEGIEDRIRKHTIRSPFDGYVTAEHTEVGQWVSSGEVVAEVMELDTVDIRVSVLEDYIDKLHVGASARVEVGALPDEAFTGEVVLIVPNADLRSRSFPVKIRVKNKMENGIVLLKSGMFASVTLPVGSSEKSLLVPKDSLVLGGPSPVVYVVDTQSESATTGTVRPTPVELGVAHQGLIQVKGALQAGQWVVTVGNERLRPGQPVQFQPPAETQVEETPKTAMR